MNKKHKAVHTGKPTVYDGTRYRSKHEATWARTFDLLGFKHQYEIDTLRSNNPNYGKTYNPDFHVWLDCGDSCGPHELMIEVKPSLKYFIDNPDHPICFLDCDQVPSPAKFGSDPQDTIWTMVHHGIHREFRLSEFPGADDAWKKAGNFIRALLPCFPDFSPPPTKITTPYTESDIVAKILYPVWTHIPTEWKKKYKYTIWTQFSDRISSACNEITIQNFITKLCLSFKIKNLPLDIIGSIYSVERAESTAILRLIKTHRIYMVARTKELNDQRKAIQHAQNN